MNGSLSAERRRKTILSVVLAFICILYTVSYTHLSPLRFLFSSYNHFFSCAFSRTKGSISSRSRTVVWLSLIHI